ncbi:tRNA U34 5-methylaminomethyl-2-thiouridine-forming methyltransferase MnmC [Spirosomataceae bacterium TFI 002]|nr:tRNA U34 5-methylaminomethyl-2-thiouridine-forming methyltransferase MnmC [Spirosomataceae bacterium TFI 002]
MHVILLVFMHNTLKFTEDGTSTLYSPRFDQYYHSRFGAKWEAERVYLELGLLSALHRFDNVRILEVGFGTGFNALLTHEKIKELSLVDGLETAVSYTGVEAYPITLSESKELNFDVSFLHKLPWDQSQKLDNNFNFKKVHTEILDFKSTEKYNLVYFDAFAPSSQPEMWTVEVFEKIASLLEPEGILTTYCSKSFVQRNLRAAGFDVEKHQGPPRKREVLRAILKFN